MVTLRYIEVIASIAERVGDYARANWIRSQAQEIQIVLERGEPWPEVWGR